MKRNSAQASSSPPLRPGAPPLGGGWLEWMAWDRSAQSPPVSRLLRTGEGREALPRPFRRGGCRLDWLYVTTTSWRSPRPATGDREGREALPALSAGGYVKLGGGPCRALPRSFRQGGRLFDVAPLHKSLPRPTTGDGEGREALPALFAGSYLRRGRARRALPRPFRRGVRLDGSVEGCYASAPAARRQRGGGLRA